MSADRVIVEEEKKFETLWSNGLDTSRTKRRQAEDVSAGKETNSTFESRNKVKKG